MKQYWRVYKATLGNALAYLTAYRFDTFMKLALGLGWALTAVLTLNIFFLHTNSFNGWEKIDVIFLFFTFELAWETSQIVANNLHALEWSVRHGLFDITITKPMDSQFLTIFLRPDLTNVIFMLSYETPLFFLMLREGINLEWTHLPLYFLLLISATGLLIALYSIVATFCFWSPRLDNLVGLIFNLIEFGKYPLTIFPRTIRLIFQTLIPVAFIAFVPAGSLLKTVSWQDVIGSISVTLILILLSRVLWRKATKIYASASS